jgi:CheY-like chemotaxis protein
VREDFETVRKNVELEARLIDDLLDLTAITRGKLSLDRKPVNLHAVLQDALATVASDIEQKGIRLVVATGADRPEVSGDAVRLQQVFWNILKNAVKFTPERGRIEVVTATAEDGQRVLVRITDSGIGLTPAERARIFDAFSQGEHAGDGAHRFGGLGLGLAISRMVIELHQGTIRAESGGRGLGASFVIDLPVVGEGSAGEELDRDAKDDESDRAHGAATVDGAGHGRILLVEDHVATRNALERLLVRRNFRVTTAGTLADARAEAGREQFDLLISDVGLPDGSGCDLMQELAARYRLRGIALTGYGMEQDQIRSFEAGFSAHLTKPVRVQALEAALATVVREV